MKNKSIKRYIGKTAKAVLGLPGKAIDTVVKRLDNVSRYKKAKTDDLIRKNFGSPENYKKVSNGMPKQDALSAGLSAGAKLLKKGAKKFINRYKK